MSDTDLSKRLEFVGMDDKALDAMKRAQPFVANAIRPALEAFYVKVRKTPEVHKFFSSESHIAGASNRQEQHWGVMAAGNYGEEYVRGVRAIGSAHARLGLEPRWYIGGYALILENLLSQLIKERWPAFASSSRGEKLAEEVSVLAKAAMVDMDLAISIYLEILEEDRKQAEAAREKAEQKQAETLDAIAQALDRLAQGDLSATVDEDTASGSAKLVDSFNNAVKSIREIVSSVGATADEVKVGATEISEATSDLSRRTEQQAASVEETAAAVVEITTSVNESAKRAEEAGQLVLRTKDAAQQSGDVVRQAIAAMGQIEKSSQEIGNIIGVIDDIAFQTNLLALNAGVEAARAGDAGKGFAVVAQEVRELAQRAASAAKEIKTLINSSGQEVQSGVSLVGETGKALENIVVEVQEVNEHVHSIVEAVREQSTSLREINTAVTAIDQGTQQNAAMVEQSTAATHSLMQQVVALNELLGRFRSGESEPAAKPAAPAGKAAGSPARELIKKVATAYPTAGNAAMKHDDWEEF